MKDEEIFGGFYDYGLQTFIYNEIYIIKKILKSRNCKGKRQFLARWLGYNSDFDSWITSEDAHNASDFDSGITCKDAHNAQ